MSAKDTINKIYELLAMEKQEAQPKQEEATEEKTELSKMKLEDGVEVEAEKFEAGQDVFLVQEDERVPMPVGMYKMEDGQVMKVEEEGVIAAMEMESDDKEEKEEEMASEAIEEKVDAALAILSDLPESEEHQQLMAILQSIKQEPEAEAEPDEEEDFKSEEAKPEEKDEKLSKEEKPEAKESDKKEELSSEEVEVPSYKHSPEKHSKQKQGFKIGAKAPASTLDRVMGYISNN